MTYFTTITKKGQITIPKKLRENLGFEEVLRVVLEVEKDEKAIKVKPVPDIIDIAGQYEVENGASVLEAREQMEKAYKRSK